MHLIVADSLVKVLLHTVRQASAINVHEKVVTTGLNSWKGGREYLGKQRPLHVSSRHLDWRERQPEGKRWD
jgi:hypothetical protein